MFPLLQVQLRRAGAVAEQVTRLPFSGPKLNQNAVEAVPLLHPMTLPL